MSEVITKWLDDLGLGQYAIAFKECDIELDLLPELDHDTLVHIGVRSPGHRLRILKAAKSFQVDSDEGGASEGSATALQAPEHAAAERRQVTVMFCDLVGSTTLSTKLDVEDMRDILLLFQQACSRVITRYEGFIARYMGDGILVYFGYPIAHENDCERAIHAGLEIIDAVNSIDACRVKRVGEKLAVRIGAASGNVVVGDIIGEGASQEAAITGEAPNLAARIQSIAVPNSMVIAEATHRLAGPLFHCMELEPKTLKGFDVPQRVFQVIDGNGTDIAETRQYDALRGLVGRQAELRQLTALADSCLETGSGQAVAIRGEAGIGKSRLVAELVSVAGARGYSVHKGLVLGFGVAKGRDAIRTIVRQLLNIPADADEGQRKQMAESAISHDLVAVDQRMFLNDLLDLPQTLEVKSVYEAMNNVTRTEGKRSTIASLISNASRNGALLLVVEDVHSADPEILGYLARLTSVIAECPALLVMTSRSEGYPLDNAWRSRAGADGMVTLDLGPLREAEAIAFAGSVAEANQGFVLNCVARAEGNPLFLEQMLLNAREGGEENIPPSLQSLIVARLDRLAKIDKRALQAASAIGQRFRPDVLCHVLGIATYSCDALVAQNLLRPEGDEFLFAHALIQDVAYDAQLKSTKRMLHKRAAQWFADCDMTLSARHLDLAEDPAAGRAYADAATQLMSAYEFEQALTLVERGLELADPDDVLFELLCARGEVLLALGLSEEAFDTYEQAAGKADEDQSIYRAHIGLAQAARQASRYESALNSLNIAQAAAVRIGADLNLAQIYYLRGNIYFPLGRVDECLESNEYAIEYARKAGSTRLHVGALSGFGDANYLQGTMRTAVDYYTQAIDIARAENLTRDLAANLHNRSIAQAYTGYIAPALADAEESLAMARTYFVPVAVCVALTCLSLTSMIVDDLDSAQAFAAENVQLTNKIGAKRFEAQAMSDLARVLAWQGHWAQARRLGREAVTIALQFAHHFVGPKSLSTLALISASTEEQDALLSQGAALLSEGCVSHCHFFFFSDAMAIMLARQDWDGALNYATGLESFTQSEPLPFMQLAIRQARLLVRTGREGPSEDLERELNAFRRDCAEANIKRTISGLFDQLPVPNKLA